MSIESDLLEEDVIPEYAFEAKREAREFAEEHIAPNAEEYFDRGEFPWKIIEAGRNAGLVAADISEEYGGRGFDVVQMVAMLEEFFRADAGIGLSLQLVSFGTEAVERYGSEQQKEEYLRPVAEGESVAGLAASEPDTGSDLAGMTTSAENDGDEWILNGEKYWIGNGVEGDWLTLYAKTNDREKNHANYSLFIVPTDADGYEAEHIPEKMALLKPFSSDIQERCSTSRFQSKREKRLPIRNRKTARGFQQGRKDRNARLKAGSHHAHGLPHP